MKCAYCGCTQSRVVDSRQSEDATTIRRRRECEKCGRRFTTYERIDLVPMMVVKKDQTRETFDVNKLRVGIVKACEKRPVSLEKIEELTRSIEQKLNAQADSEITSKMIGELVMDGLKDLDEVAYVRFASVYRQFRDIQSFRDELNKLLMDFDPGTTDGEANTSKG
ncbi:MAG: transcriptional repressor NrdR [Clostridia bacterium]|nr:transcriptional repressor NrdR [Clostridia bacterium]